MYKSTKAASIAYTLQQHPSLSKICCSELISAEEQHLCCVLSRAAAASTPLPTLQHRIHLCFSTVYSAATASPDKGQPCARITSLVISSCACCCSETSYSVSDEHRRKQTKFLCCSTTQQQHQSICVRQIFQNPKFAWK